MQVCVCRVHRAQPGGPSSCPERECLPRPQLEGWSSLLPALNFIRAYANSSFPGGSQAHERPWHDPWARQRDEGWWPWPRGLPTSRRIPGRLQRSGPWVHTVLKGHGMHWTKLDREGTGIGYDGKTIALVLVFTTMAILVLCLAAALLVRKERKREREVSLRASQDRHVHDYLKQISSWRCLLVVVEGSSLNSLCLPKARNVAIVMPWHCSWKQKHHDHNALTSPPPSAQPSAVVVVLMSYCRLNGGH